MLTMLLKSQFYLWLEPTQKYKTPLGSDLVRRSYRCVLYGGGGVEGQSEKGRAVYGSEDRGVLRCQHCDTLAAGALS